MDHIFLNVAVSCGVQKVPPVFIDRGIPVEYELVRSICTVSQQKRKKLGVLKTDAQLYGSFNMQTMSASPNWPIIDELEKQYEVVQGRSGQADHREVRRAAGRAAVVAGPAGDGQLRRGGRRTASRRPSSRTRRRCSAAACRPPARRASRPAA